MLMKNMRKAMFKNMPQNLLSKYSNSNAIVKSTLSRNFGVLQDYQDRANKKLTNNQLCTDR